VDLPVKQALHWMGSGIRTCDGSERGCSHFMYFTLSVFVSLKVVCDQVIEWDDEADVTVCRVRSGRCAQSFVLWCVESVHSVCGGSGCNYVVAWRWWCGSGQPAPVSGEYEQALLRELAYCYKGAVQCRNVQGARDGEEAVTKAEKCCASADCSGCGIVSKSNGNSWGL
jgi:hypothetical protein